MTRCNARPVAKLSDSPGKLMAADPVFLSYLRQTFQLAPPPDVPVPFPVRGGGTGAL